MQKSNSRRLRRKLKKDGKDGGGKDGGGKDGGGKDGGGDEVAGFEENRAPSRRGMATA